MENNTPSVVFELPDGKPAQYQLDLTKFDNVKDNDFEIKVESKF